MSGFGAGIRRGVMAADQFTQISGGLFRDGLLSSKAKGIFGYVSTHRSGWRATITNLVRLGPDSREAVRAGLKELQEHGYLIRGPVHFADAPDDEPPAHRASEQPSTPPAARTVAQALTYRALVACAGCGAPGTAPGEDLCPACLAWPLSGTCPGPTSRRAHPHSDGRCTTCATPPTGPTQGSTP